MVVVFYEKMLKKGLVFCVVAFLASCSSGEKEEIVSSAFNLQKVEFSQLKNWNEDDAVGFGKALRDVCIKLQRQTSPYLSSEKINYSLSSYKKHCQNILELHDDTEVKSYIGQYFQPYAVVVDGDVTGKFTSYYEATLRASYTRGGKYQYPIYGKPKDLVEINLRDFDSSLPNMRLVGRVKDGKMIKYYTRQEIDEGKLDAPVILWGDDPVDIYIMQIQGAGVATLPDGKEIRVAYADNNGHKFKGIGSILLEKGLIKSGDASMPKIREWLRENGETAKKNMLLNDRFIFHKIVTAEGPIGAMGLPLVAGRSLAVDRYYIPLGSIMWLETTGPDGELINKLVVAEDVGSAIKGGIRGDYFWGHGEEALESAGRMNSKGRYFILIPNDAEVKIND